MLKIKLNACNYKKFVIDIFAVIIVFVILSCISFCVLIYIFFLAILILQIVKARAILQHGLQSQVKQGSDDFWRHSSFRAAEDGFNSLDNFEMEKHSIPATSEAEFVDKFVVNEGPYLRKQVKELVVENLDDDDEWPEDENNAAGMAAVLAGDEEDISFSDLEEEDDCFSKQTYSRNGSKLSSD